MGDCDRVCGGACPLGAQQSDTSHSLVVTGECQNSRAQTHPPRTGLLWPVTGPHVLRLIVVLKLLARRGALPSWGRKCRDVPRDTEPDSLARSFIFSCLDDRGGDGPHPAITFHGALCGGDGPGLGDVQMAAERVEAKAPWPANSGPLPCGVLPWKRWSPVAIKL